MSLETIYYIGQTIAVGAVTPSLIFVGLQVRQNTKAQHMVAQQQYYALKNAFVSQIAEGSAYADIYRKGLEDLNQLSETERWQFGAMMQISFDTALSGFQNPDAVGGELVRAWEITLRPGSIEWWKNGRTLYPQDFQQWVDAAIEKRRSQHQHEPGKAQRTTET